MGVGLPCGLTGLSCSATAGALDLSVSPLSRGLRVELMDLTPSRDSAECFLSKLKSLELPLSVPAVSSGGDFLPMARGLGSAFLGWEDATVFPVAGVSGPCLSSGEPLLLRARAD